MSFAFANMTEKLIPISDFSQGKAGKIFNDVAQNNSEYIVLKNNQPTAVLISVNVFCFPVGILVINASAKFLTAFGVSPPK